MTIRFSIRVMPLFGFLTAIFVSGFLWTNTSLAAASSPSDNRNPVIVYTDDAVSLRPGGPAERLLERAQVQRLVRVIVGLRTIMRMEHTLSEAQLTHQRGALARLQNSVTARVFGSASADGVDRFQFIPYMSMFVTQGQLRRLLAVEQVVSIQEDIPAMPALGESVPLINADDVWSKGPTGARQVVAVLDTGVDKTHPMFFGGRSRTNVVSEACYSTTRTVRHFSYSSLCPGGVAESTRVGAGRNCPVTLLDCDHGTRVASIAAGSSSDAPHNLDGVAPDARLIAVKVFTRRSDNTGALPDTIASYNTDIIKGLERVYSLRDQYAIAAVNMSFGAGHYAAECDAEFPAMATAIANLRDVGIATVVAAGNGGKTDQIQMPACISGAIAVGGTTPRDVLWAHSDHSAQVQLLAPGAGIRTAVPAGSSCITDGNPYCTDSGTSFAAPHVAGAFALLKQAKSDATVDEIVDALACSGKMIEGRQATDGGPNLPLGALATPRIDLIGAYNDLRNRRAERLWLFSDRGDSKDWSPLPRGRWWVGGGAYQADGGPGWIGSAVANCNTRFRVVAKLRASGNPDPTAPVTLVRSGIFVKANVDYATKRLRGYWFYYVLNPVTPESSLAEVSFINARFDLNESFTSVRRAHCAQFHTIAIGSVNSLKVLSDGNAFSFWFNGTHVCNVNAQDHELGSSVIVAQRVPDPPNGTAFAVNSVTINDLRPGEELAAARKVAVMDPTKFAPARTAAGVAYSGAFGR